LRVLAIDAPDTKPAASGSSFGRTVTLDVTAEQAEKINVATELGKLSLILRSIINPNGLAPASPIGPPGKASSVKPTWAGDVSPALSGAAPEKAVAVQQPSVEVVRGSRQGE